MKLKEIERSAVQSWSPATQHPIYLATGTSAQQLDATFNTSAALEIFEVDFGEPHPEMKRKGIFPAENRFHKIIWGSFEGESVGPSGVIIGGGDNGEITLYSTSQILTSGKEAVITKNGKHTGPVRALDLNPFQNNLLASGANDSEVFIWDLNNFSVPMTPGAKSQPVEDVSAVSWNQQVQHILSSAHPSGKAVVWDLRKNEPVIKVSDHTNRMHVSGLLWHPEIATQLVLSSEDDRLPVVQVWDLRFASSPLKMLENHNRGILSISWSKDDPDLLLSSSKDHRILCWNPSTSEVVYELPVGNQWCFDVQWCPRNPSVFSAASFDGWVSVYSVMGGSLEAQQRSQAERISSSFNNLDPFGTGQSLPPLQVPQQATQTTLIPPLKKPPRWIRRPVGVSFAFGGKLVTFDCPKAAVHTQDHTPREVYISQVTTEKEFLRRSSELQTALLSGNLLGFCQSKVQNTSHAFDKSIWNFLKVNFEQDAREKFLKLLGYSKEELDKKIAIALGDSLQNKGSPPEADDLAQSIQSVSSQASSSFTGHTVSSSSSMEFFNLPPPETKFDIPVTSDTDGLISQALLLGNFEAAVDLCLKDGRYADAIILANAGGEDLLRETQQWYFARQKNKITTLLSSIVQHKWRDVVLNCNLQSWKEALALLLTYSRPEEYAELCDTLGNRLESEGEGKLSSQACLCYISSGNVDRLTECWVRNHKTSTSLALQLSAEQKKQAEEKQYTSLDVEQLLHAPFNFRAHSGRIFSAEDLVEKAMVLRKSIELLRGSVLPPQGPVLSEKVAQYASLLASQGNLTAAMNYLPSDSEESSVHELRERLLHAQGQVVNGQRYPLKTSSSYPSTTAKPSKASDGSLYKEGSKQALSHSAISTAFSPSVPSQFIPQPMPAPVPPPSIPFQPPSGSSSNIYHKYGAWQPYAESQPQPTVPGIVQPPPLKQTPPMSTHTTFPASPFDVPMNVPGVSNTYPQGSVPGGSHPYPQGSVPGGSNPYPQGSVPGGSNPYPQGSVPGGSNPYPQGSVPGGSNPYPQGSVPGGSNPYPQGSVPGGSNPYPQGSVPGGSNPYPQGSVPGGSNPYPQGSVPGGSNTYPQGSVPGGYNTYPQGSVPPLHSSAYHPVSRPGMSQPPTPPTMTASHPPFNYQPDLGFREGGPGAPTVLPPPPTAGEQEGWTDSFSMKSGIHRKKNPHVPPAPITTPVMNLPSEPEFLQPHLGSNLNPCQSPPGAPKESSTQLHRMPVEKIEKKELPAEHLPLQRTFSGLVQRCSAVASDPKTKRKLEDTSQRLECLYDKLRENTLSPNILAGLHDIACCMEGRNYQQGLAVHTHVVSGSNFSEVSGFMPILKVLMTIASKLGV